MSFFRFIIKDLSPLFKQALAGLGVGVVFVLIVLAITGSSVNEAFLAFLNAACTVLSFVLVVGIIYAISEYRKWKRWN